MIKPIPRTSPTRRVFINIGMIILIYGPAIYLYQFHTWLQERYWPAMPISRFWFWIGGPSPAFPAESLQHAAMALLETPISAAAVLTGAAIVMLSLKPTP